MALLAQALPRKVLEVLEASEILGISADLEARSGDSAQSTANRQIRAQLTMRKTYI